MFKKIPIFLGIIMLSLAAVTFSCNKHDDDDDDWGGGNGGGDLFGYEYVDLGLPSGTLWATCNVGAENPEDYGDYFAWGETQPKTTYNWSTYKYTNGSSDKLTKYCINSQFGYNGFTDNLTTLLPEDDAATANWGAGWRMPTKEEFQELYNNTSVTWTIQNGVNGRRFTASNGNSIFLPAAGSKEADELYHAGRDGYYWSSLSVRPTRTWFLEFNSEYYQMMDEHGDRCYGQSVRPVRSGQNGDNNTLTVTTSNVTDITQTTAVCGGNVTVTGNSMVTNRGVCWNTSPNPTINDNHTSNGMGTGNFTSSITGLTPNTTYYVRAYATNNSGTVYGAQKTFSTTAMPTAPSVVTNSVTNITQDAAICGGNVTSDGGSPVTARGVCWSTNPNPTTSDNHTNDGTGTGSFTSSITGLTQSTTYYVRAYATNNVGTVYGAEKTFTTTDYAATYIGNYLGQITLTITSMNNTPVNGMSFPIDNFHIEIAKIEQLNTVIAIVTINNESHQTYGVATEEKVIFNPFNFVLDMPEQQCLYNLDLKLDGQKTNNETLNIIGTFSGNGSAIIMGQELVFDEISGPASGILMKQ